MQKHIKEISEIQKPEHNSEKNKIKKNETFGKTRVFFTEMKKKVKPK